MTSEFTELLTVLYKEKVQIWIIGTHDQVNHIMNEFCACKITTDRLNFTPIVPAPIISGKYMTALLR